MNERLEKNIGDGIVLETETLGKQVSSPEGPLTILDDVTMQVTAGESIALVGPSGAGKTRCWHYWPVSTGHRPVVSCCAART